MPNYDIEAVGVACAEARKVMVTAAKLSGNMDPQQQKDHDSKYTKMLMAVVKEITAYHDEFGEKVKILKQDAKEAMDRIEATIKAKKGKLEAGDWRVLEQDQQKLIQYAQDFSKELKGMYADMGPWRANGWTIKMKEGTFTEGAHNLIESVIKIRARYMTLQSSEWSPAIERMNAYVPRAEAILLAAKKISKNAGGAGEAELEKMNQALTEAWDRPGSKTSPATLANKMDSVVSRAKETLKKGVTSGYTDKQKEAIDSGLDMAKTLRGALKSLEILKKSAAELTKVASKEFASGWAELNTKIKTALASAEKAVKQSEEYEKLAPKLTKIYQDFDAKNKGK